MIKYAAQKDTQRNIVNIVPLITYLCAEGLGQSPERVVTRVLLIRGDQACA